MGRDRVGFVGGLLAVSLGYLACSEQPGTDLAVAASSLVSGTFPVRGYTRSDGENAIVFVAPGTGRVHEVRFSGTGGTADGGALGSGGRPGGSDGGQGGGKVETNLGTAMVAGGPWGYKRTDNMDVVMYIDTSAHVREIARVNGVWEDGDFTTSSVVGAPLASVGASMKPDIFAYLRSDNRNTVLYVSVDFHIIEVASNFGSSPPWFVSDLTTFTGGPPLLIPSAMAYIRSDGKNAVVYVGSDNHIHEIRSNFPSAPAWSDTDLFSASGETVSPATAPWAYRRSDDINAVVYVGGSPPLLHELWLNPNVPCSPTHLWCTGVISVAQGPVSSERPFAFVRADQANEVVYVGTATAPNQTMRVSVLPIGGDWADSPLSSQQELIGTFHGAFGRTAPGPRTSVLFPQRPDNSADFRGVEISSGPGAPAMSTF
jgi:hypothetical protein